MTADLVIKGGTVVDGTGAPGVRADVAISDGRITAIGPDLDGDRVLDAGGHVVAPGFIDIHTHYDAQVFWDPALTPSCFHGVTTVVAGNCGFSIAPTRPEHREVIARTLENVEDMDVDTLAAGIPWDFSTFPEYLASVERRGTALNFAAYIGHTALRLFVMGDAAYERAATDDEIARMQAVLREALRGRCGRLRHQLRADASRRRRHAGSEPLRRTRRARRAPRRGRRGSAAACSRSRPATSATSTTCTSCSPAPVCRSPTARCSRAAQGGHRRSVEINDDGWARGAQVWPQVSPRPLMFAMTWRRRSSST